MNFDELGLSQEEINQLVNSQKQDQYSLNSPSFVQGKPKDEILGKDGQKNYCLRRFGGFYPNENRIFHAPTYVGDKN